MGADCSSFGIVLVLSELTGKELQLGLLHHASAVLIEYCLLQVLVVLQFFKIICHLMQCGWVCCVLVPSLVYTNYTNPFVQQFLRVAFPF